MAIDAGNRGGSGKRKAEVVGCSMETLARKGRNGRASQALYSSRTFAGRARASTPGVADGIEQHTVMENKPGSYSSPRSIEICERSSMSQQTKGSWANGGV